MTQHQPVLLKTLLEIVDPSPGKFIIDATFGGGGHSIAFARAGATVFSIDKDPTAIKEGERLLGDIACPAPQNSNTVEPKSFSFPSGGSITLFQASFAQLGFLPNPAGADAIVFDLGLSSDQLASQKGFSFQNNCRLDMRLDPKSQAVTAADLLQTLSGKQIQAILTQYSQEVHARAIARSIVETRAHNPIQTTHELVKAILNVVPNRGKIHPATKTFQALRIAVNSELEELGTALDGAWGQLRPMGLLAVISFHSGEDRIVKLFARNKNPESRNRPITPHEDEIRSNPRSRSAKLRIIRKK